MAKAEEHNDHAQGQKGGNENAPGQNKSTVIFINTIEHQWLKKEISFEELVALAFPNAQRMEFDVTYSKGQSDQEGELMDGDSIHVHPNMEFIVTPTNES